MTAEIRQKLEELHGLLATEFISRIGSGEAEPALLNAARQFLKDNGVDAAPKSAVNPLDTLNNILLPFPNTKVEVDLPRLPKHIIEA